MAAVVSCRDIESLLHCFVNCYADPVKPSLPTVDGWGTDYVPPFGFVCESVPGEVGGFRLWLEVLSSPVVGALPAEVWVVPVG